MPRMHEYRRKDWLRFAAYTLWGLLGLVLLVWGIYGRLPSIGCNGLTLMIQAVNLRRLHNMAIELRRWEAWL